MPNPYKYRDLFKPILNTAARAAYKMKANVAPGLKKAQESPYTQGYWDLVTKKRGRAAQLFAIGAPIYAGHKIAGLVPERAEEIVTEDKEELIEEKDGKKDSVLITEEEKKEIIPEDIEVGEDVNYDDAEETKIDKANALLDQSNEFMGDYDNDSLN